MSVSADRASGGFFLFLGLALYFLIIPTFVEKVEGGNIHPDTMPNAVSIVIAVCGLLLMLKPTTHQTQSSRYFLAAAIYITILGAATYAMTHFGFIYVAPFMALLIMLKIGERKPLWLFIGVIGMPSLIWVLVAHVLDRGLP